MSNVTNIILTFGSIDRFLIMEDDSDEAINIINKWLLENENGEFSEHLDPFSGGNKHLECSIYIAAFNYFGLDKFVELIKTILWKRPESVQLMIRGEHDYKFRIIEPFNNKE